MKTAMPALNTKTLETAILNVLAELGTKKTHKYNLIGRPYQTGALEQRLGVRFDQRERADAASAFDRLRAEGYIQPTFDDLADPENWVSITNAGRQFLNRVLPDHIDLRLASIREHLVELRRGMHDAANRTSPDAPRQAIHSARELIDQVLKEGTDTDCQTRKQRAKRLLEQNQTNSTPSKSDIDIIDACCRLIESEQSKAMALAHGRQSIRQSEARVVVEAAERILRLFFPGDVGNS